MDVCAMCVPRGNICIWIFRFVFLLRPVVSWAVFMPSPLSLLLRERARVHQNAASLRALFNFWPEIQSMTTMATTTIPIINWRSKWMAAHRELKRRLPIETHSNGCILLRTPAPTPTAFNRCGDVWWWKWIEENKRKSKTTNIKR